MEPGQSPCVQSFTHATMHHAMGADENCNGCWRIIDYRTDKMREVTSSYNQQWTSIPSRGGVSTIFLATAFSAGMQE